MHIRHIWKLMNYITIHIWRYHSWVRKASVFNNDKFLGIAGRRTQKFILLHKLRYYGNVYAYDEPIKYKHINIYDTYTMIQTSSFSIFLKFEFCYANTWTHVSFAELSEENGICRAHIQYNVLFFFLVGATHQPEGAATACGSIYL